MVRKAYAVVKFSCKKKEKLRKKIFVDISQSVTACSMGSRLVSSFLDPWSHTSKRVIFCPICLCFCSRSFVWSVPCSWHNNLSNNRLTVPCCFTILSVVISDVFLVVLNTGSLAADEPFLVVFIPFFTTFFRVSAFSVRHRFYRRRIRFQFLA